MSNKTSNDESSKKKQPKVTAYAHVLGNTFLIPSPQTAEERQQQIEHRNEMGIEYDVRDVTVITLEEPKLVNYRVSRITNPLYTNISSNPLLPKGFSLSRLLEAFVSSDIGIGIKSDANVRLSSPNGAGLLTDDELHYFRTRNGEPVNNVTVVIPGGNLCYGEFGKVILAKARDILLPDTKIPIEINPLMVNGVALSGLLKAPYSLDKKQMASVIHSSYSLSQKGTSGTVYQLDDAMETASYHFGQITDSQIQWELYFSDIEAHIYRDYELLVTEFPQARQWGAGNDKYAAMTDFVPRSSADVSEQSGYSDFSVDSHELPMRDALMTVAGEKITASNANVYLNGTGVHNRLLNIENNLNLAAGYPGFSDVLDLNEGQLYTRALTVAWQSDLCNPYDYSSLEQMAMVTAEPVAKLITQLKQAGLEVNILAEGAGGMVAHYAMELLARAGHSNVITNVFFNQPLQPNTVFSNAPKADKSINQHWQTPHAWQAAETLHVIYSQHDNTLGPLAVHDSNHDSKLLEKYQAGVKGQYDMWQSLFVDALDTLGIPNPLRSPYHMVQHFGDSPDILLFDSTKRQANYTAWLSHHGKHASGNHYLGMPTYQNQLSDQAARLGLSSTGAQARSGFGHLRVLLGYVFSAAQGLGVEYLQSPVVQQQLTDLHCLLMHQVAGMQQPSGEVVELLQVNILGLFSLLLEKRQSGPVINQLYSRLTQLFTAEQMQAVLQEMKWEEFLAWIENLVEDYMDENFTLRGKVESTVTDKAQERVKRWVEVHFDPRVASSDAMTALLEKIAQRSVRLGELAGKCFLPSRLLGLAFFVVNHMAEIEGLVKIICEDWKDVIHGHLLPLFHALNCTRGLSGYYGVDVLSSLDEQLTAVLQSEDISDALEKRGGALESLLAKYRFAGNCMDVDSEDSDEASSGPDEFMSHVLQLSASAITLFAEEVSRSRQAKQIVGHSEQLEKTRDALLAESPVSVMRTIAQSITRISQLALTVPGIKGNDEMKSLTNDELRAQLEPCQVSVRRMLAKSQQLQEQSEKFADYALQQGGELAAFMVTVLSTKEAVPATAMGYDFDIRNIPDQFTRDMINSKKIDPIDGTKWVFYHEAMVRPSKDIMENLYEPQIMGADTMKFGRYDLHKMKAKNKGKS